MEDTLTEFEKEKTPNMMKQTKAIMFGGSMFFVGIAIGCLISERRDLINYFIMASLLCSVINFIIPSSNKSQNN